ncbi:MAG TPA: BON domain-containing protein [Steroidobacteraceae bacterium]|jgi:hyperosmotically inducible protein|nr:BON domain-containing protein [Steroidobacteraceae bacterium]
MYSNGRIVPAGLIALALAALAALAAGCASTPQRESTGQAIDDSAITAKVKAALVADPETKARDISVKTYRGLVQLSGFVDSDAERHDAERIARHEDGVRGVQDELVIQTQRSTIGRVVDDSAVTAKVKAALVANPDTKARDIDVTTSHGVVQLSGFVDNREQRDAAAEVAKSVTGVRAVDNGLQLKPPAQ